MNAATRNSSLLPAVALAAMIALASPWLTGCDRLAHGTKINPLDQSEFFADGQSSRHPPRA